ncbi:protein kinase [Calditrichota bacterium]
MVDKTISHYKILRKIGKGGMGEVYLAQDNELDRLVAIKTLPAEILSDEAIKERFKREAKTAAALNHPNIVTIYEFGEFDHTNYIAMEYVEGISLKELITKRDISTEQVLNIAIQICEGLKEAHKANIIHRDLKPDNILIDKNERIKIVDFGLAKLKGAKQVTKESTTLGTPNYMAPEQYQNSPIDMRTDIWSFGVILYEMINGEMPFKGNNEAEVMYSVLSKEPESISESWVEYPEAIKSIVLNSVKKNPEERYQNVTDLLNDLSAAIEHPKLKFISTGKKVKTEIPKRFKTAAVIITSIVIILTTYFLINNTNWLKLDTADNVNWENSIAVLPFKNMSSDPEQEYFCDGMTEQIISNLAKLPRLKVIARTSVMGYKETKKKIPEIGHELNVSHILEGSIRKNGNHIRVTAQLINSKDSFHIWSQDYDKEFEDIFEVQDDVSETIAKSLLKKISGEEISQIKTQRPKNIEAYEYLLKGNYYHDKLFIKFDPEDWKTAEQMYKKSIIFDPGFADTYASLADLYNSHYMRMENTNEEKVKYMALQESYIDTALQIDSTSAFVYVAKGWMHRAKTYEYDRLQENDKIEHELDKAFKCYKKAKKIDDKLIFADESLADFFLIRGLYRIAVRFYTKSIENDPLAPGSYVFRAFANFRLEKYENTEVDFKKVLEIQPDKYDALRHYTQFLIAMKRYNEAESLLVRREKIYPDQNTNWEHALIYASKGDKEKALKTWKYDSPHLYALLGMNKEAVSMAEKWSDNQLKLKTSRYYDFKNHPFFDNIRNDPGFQVILEKHKKLYDENLRKYGYLD